MATSERRISGLARNFEEYRSELLKYTQQYYPDILNNLNDASVGDWFLDLNASVGDNLSNYIDRAFQETNIDEAQLRRSLFAIARTKGLKIPGKKASLVECEITCEVPMNSNSEPDYNYMPIIRKGTQAMGNGRIFEFTEDSDFSNQFNVYGISNRTIVPKRDSNGSINGYVIKKREVLSGSQTKIYSVVIDDYMITPFMEIVLPDSNVLSVDSIILKEGTNFQYTPSTQDFALKQEFLDSSKTSDKLPTWKYFEVDSLLEDKLFLPEMENVNNNYPKYKVDYFSAFSITQNLGGENDVTIPANNYYKIGEYGSVEYTKVDIIKNGGGKNIYLLTNAYNTSVIPGSWKTIKQKYITEYTDKGFMRIIFGAGSDYGYFGNETLTAGQEQIRRIINNENMGVLPNPGQTMFIQYRVGGGQQSNIASNVINSFSLRNIEVPGNGENSTENAYKRNQVDSSIRITNTYPSVSGKDAPSNEEIRYMIKYNNLAQNRCVTLQDYKDRLNKMPAIYGSPFRTGIYEKNNIIYISVLGIDQNSHLTDVISNVLLDNMSNYLSEYKTIGDYVLIKPGKVVNLQVEVDVIINKAHNNNDVVKSVIETTNSFFDINKHKMGENLYISRLTQEILNINGVDSLIEVRVYNIFDEEYSRTRISQAIIAGHYAPDGQWVSVNNSGTNRVEVDLKSSEGILFSDTDTMFEIRNMTKDIKVRVKNN